MPTPKSGRPVGRPPKSAEEKAAQATLDTHMNIPVHVVKAIDHVRGNLSRKDYILQVILEREEIQAALQEAEGKS